MGTDGANSRLYVYVTTLIFKDSLNLALAQFLTIVLIVFLVGGLFFFLLMFEKLKKPDQECTHSPEQFSCVRYVSNYDGDTVKLDIPGVHPLFGSKISIRLLGIDTAELRNSGECEKKIGLIARDYVAERMTNAERIDLINISRGKYFRVVADVILDGQSLSETLMLKGYAIKYDGKSKNDQNWCELLESDFE